jgi:hypothetical protein
MLPEVEEFCRARTEEGAGFKEGEEGGPSEEGIVVPLATSLPDLGGGDENDDSDADDIQSDTAEEFVVIDVAMEADQFDEGA